MNRCLPAAVLVLTLAVPLRADENDWFVPLGRPPKASPRRISGGESFPPLPLPATPVRRSERKRQPKPGTLIGKVAWGETASFTYDNGSTTRISDWNLCPADIQQLLKKSGRWFGLPYSTEAINLAAFHGDPQRTPVLLLNGGRRIRLDEGQRDALRRYVMRGGMVVFDSIAGSPYFYESSKQLTQEVFPEFALRVIPPDHPLYHMIYDIEEVSYPKNLDSSQPFLEGIYVGARIGVLISKYGLGCGWDDHEVPFLDKAIYYDVDSANRIGHNLVAYAIGYGNVGIEEAKPEAFGSLDEKRPTDEFVFAQIKHGGAWNVHPGAAAALLRRLRSNTSLRVSLKRVSVDPGKDDISAFPFLFLTGLDDFGFDDKAVGELRAFLNSTGTLFINNGLGLSTFDRAVRRELQRILPEAELKPVPPEHPLYQAVFPVDTVRYTPAVLSRDATLAAPRLEGVTINGDLRVIYSPFDMECAWLGIEYPLALETPPNKETPCPRSS